MKKGAEKEGREGRLDPPSRSLMVLSQVDRLRSAASALFSACKQVSKVKEQPRFLQPESEPNREKPPADGGGGGSSSGRAERSPGIIHDLVGQEQHLEP